MIAMKKTGVLLSAAVAGLFAATTPASAQSSGHIDRVALQLQRDVRELHHEVHSHFRATPHFAHLDRDVAAMERLARHIHDVAHRGGSLGHLRDDVRQLDRLLHHVEDIVEDITHSNRVDRRTIAHLRRALADVSRTLHHLQRDLR